MRWSQAFLPTLREDPAEATVPSHRLMLRAGLIRQLSAGAYTYLPLGLRVLHKVQQIIRNEMNSAGAQELLMPALQPAELWKRSGRYDVMQEILLKVKDRQEKEQVFGPTHEEVITDLVRQEVTSYRQLPQILYQIQTKFRDEPRPRFGVIRSKEFIMKDAYSFDKDQAGLNASYEKMFQAYQATFKRCGLDAIPVEAESGMMGGDVSHEFMVVAPAGEDTIIVCPKCPYRANKEMHDERSPGAKCPKCGASVETQHAIEVGHVFKLGTKYSDAFGAQYQDESGKLQPMIMGCYGIGVNRIIAACIEQHHDDDGIIWPAAIAPYLAVIIPVQMQNEAVRQAAEALYHRLTQAGLEVVLDDRDERAGVKFKDADLLGFPFRLTVSDKSLAQQAVELKTRADPQPTSIPLERAIETLRARVTR